MHTSTKELADFFDKWSPMITIMQSHDDLVDKQAPAFPIPRDRVNQWISMEKLYLIQKSDICRRCGEGNQQAISGSIKLTPGLDRVPSFIFLDVCLGDTETLEHFCEHRIRAQVALGLQQAIYNAGYGFVDVGWPRSIFDHPDQEKRLLVM